MNDNDVIGATVTIRPALESLLQITALVIGFGFAALALVTAYVWRRVDDQLGNCPVCTPHHSCRGVVRARDI
jgi:hypothetical protein